MGKRIDRRVQRAVASTFESLEGRRLLANDPLTVGSFLIGTASWLNVTGSANDDTIVVQKTAATTFRITNGEWVVTKTGSWVGLRVSGGEGADSVSVSGSISFKTIQYGNAGNDTLSGGALADSIFGGDGNDSITGNAGNDTLRGEGGDDVIAGSAGADNALGGLGNDSLVGGTENDVLGGDAGTDTVLGDAGNDTLSGGTEADSILGGDGNDSLKGDAGADTLNGEAGNDVALGGTEADSILGEAGNDSLNGEAGADTLAGAAGADVLNGGADDDSVDAGTDDDRIVGDAGNDTYIGGDGADTLDYTGRTVALTLSYDGQANDGAAGETDNVPADVETLIGGNVGDTITGDENANILKGGAGNDTIDGAAGDDKLFGGAGADSLSGGDDNDTVRGEADNDKLFGNAGEDLLEGGLGNDQLNGDAGRDRLIALGGGIYDSLTGGDDMDSYWLDRDTTEKTLDVSAEETTARAVHRVGAFVNYGTTVISKEITGPKLAEPAKHSTLPSNKLVNYSSYSLFSDAGPSIDDVNQGQAGDCWFLSSLAGVAKVNAERIRQSITDLGDGTYAVRFGPASAEKYVRVDADLFSYSWLNNVPTYATLGVQNSTWVALMEKAYTWVRADKSVKGQYATLDGGWMNVAYSALGMTPATQGWGSTFASGNAAVDHIRDQLDAGKTVTLGTKSTASYNLVGGHAYTVDHVVDNGDGTYNVVLRNPWGIDNGTSTDGQNDGYVTITPAQLFASFSGLASAA